MKDKNAYIKDFEEKIEKYQKKISHLDDLLREYQSQNKEDMTSERIDLKEKYKSAEEILKKLKASSQENFEEIKDASVDILSSLNAAFSEFSHLFTMDQLNHTKDQALDYGNEKVAEVEEYIKSNPLTSAAWALGVGFLIGTFLKRSK